MTAGDKRFRGDPMPYRLCAWGHCNDQAEDGRAPLCRRHRLKAWACVEVDRQAEAEFATTHRGPTPS